MARTASRIESFPGFSPQVFRFLRDLQSHNDRDWFAKNKPRYEEYVVGPALQFITALQPGIAKLSRFLEAVPKRQGGSLLRIYRDTRFSKDKQPYKTNVGLHFRHRLGGDIHAPGLYLHLEPGSCFVGAGIWMPSSEPLAMIRRSIDEDPKSWKRIRDNEDFIAKYRLDGESVKTAPRGFPKDHPMIEDLRRKSFIGIASLPDDAFTNAGVLTTVLGTFASARPLMKYLCNVLQQPF